MNVKLGSEKFKERLRNTFVKMSTIWFEGGVKKHFLGHRKLQRDRRSAAMLPWLRREYVLTHEERLSLSDDTALALVRICLTPRSRRGNLEQGTKTMLKPEESPHWAKEPILAQRAAGRVATLGRRSQFWREGRQQLGWRRCQCGTQIRKVNLCRRLIGLG